MCSPSAIGSASGMGSPAAMGAAGGLGSVANQLENYGNWRAARDARSTNLLFAGQQARKDLFEGWSNLAVRRVQHLQQTTQEVQQISNRAAMMSSSAVVGAAESGVGGNALGKLLGDYQRTSLIEQDRRLIEQDNYDRLIMEEAQSMRSQAQGRIYGAFTQAGAPSQPFNWLAAASAVMGGGMGGFTNAGGKLFSSNPGTPPAGGQFGGYGGDTTPPSPWGGTPGETSGIDFPDFGGDGGMGVGLGLV